MARKRRRSRKNNSSGAGMFALGLLVLSALAAGGYFLWKQSYREPELDEATLCPKDAPVSVSSVLFDGTDQLSPETVQDIKNQLRKYIAAMPRYQKLQVYVLEPGSELDAPIVAKCNPGNVQDLNSWQSSGITANPRLIQERWENEFWKPLEAAIDQTLSLSKDAESSPIFHSLQWINLRVGARVQQTTLIISDMMENTKDYSMYRDGLNPQSFINSPAYQKFGADYTNTDFEAWVIQRENTLDKQGEIKKFWASVMSSYGAPNFATQTLVGVQ